MYYNDGDIMNLDIMLKGNCYELIKNIDDNSINLVYIDIPYLVKNMELGNGNIKKLTGFTKDKNSKRMETRVNTFQEIGKMCNGIDYSILDDLCRVMKKINIFIWCSKEQILDLMFYFIKQKNCMFEILCWCKTNPTPFCNNTWLPDIEYCLYFREKGTRLNNIYNLKSKFYVSKNNIQDKKKYKHPTIKPLDLVKRHILHTTSEGDVVLDCFAGSGTTLVACKETNRRYIGMEINEEYFKICIKRLKGDDNER